ncbi:hypothetical protein [Nonomuraea mesophila]|uniref:hypothetical protein n=1 Tax=Nonomuraea mesophila TaxID=2530382 RepID=UPI0015F2EC84|nr:hypothetical protein [Nonomuraea mesophila]
MGGLLAGNAPLRGRAGLELVVPTLDYRLAADFWQISDPRFALLTHAVLKGGQLFEVLYRQQAQPESGER